VNVYSDISSVKGVGEKSKEVLNKCGIFNVMDLLLYFPRDYEIASLCKDINEYDDGEKVIIEASLVEIQRDQRTKNNKVITTLVFESDNKLFKGKWFNQPYVKNKLFIGNKYLLMGKVQKFKGEVCIINPLLKNDKEKQTGEKAEDDKIIPKYALKENLSNNFIIKIVSGVLENIRIEENLPEYILEKFSFSSLDFAIRNIHSPKDYNSLKEATKRLKFQELFIYSLKILMLKDFINRNREGIAFKMAPELTALKEQLPFQLTNAQSRVVREILLDQKKASPMNRLVQGDVGSGKTIVAIIALFNVVKNGYQGALMAPTEILAIQHSIEAEKLLGSFGIRTRLLSGSTTQKEKEQIKNSLKEGEIDIIIGTHALIEEDVEFKNLGMVVTDEQHRFGVVQRNKLFNKGKNIDVLVMTATPIPRTLSLYLYGDLEVSIINELPPGRQNIETFYVKESEKDRVYSFALEEIKKGRQVYVVCPLVEENEELNLSSVEKHFEVLKSKYFKDIPIEILHGKMPSKTKDAIMKEFKEGNTKLLVSTTVIEVGINVPNATLMIIENAERFGLAQLHQLRGRVGRGSHKSYCLLVANIKNKIVEKRMEIMKNSNDGFYIAEQDLKIRGGGELLGVKQSGENSLILSDIIEDIEILKVANKEAKLLISSEDEKDIKVKNEILKKIEQTSKYICFN